MFVGRISQLGKHFKFADLGCAGAALGGLGRHTLITPDGMPIFDDHTEVAFKVGATDPSLLLYIQWCGPNHLTDHLYYTVDADCDIWIYKTGRDPLLSKVS